MPLDTTSDNVLSHLRGLHRDASEIQLLLQRFEAALLEYAEDTVLLGKIDSALGLRIDLTLFALRKLVDRSTLAVGVRPESCR